MDIKQAISISMYQTTTSMVIIVHNGLTGFADANCGTLRFEGPPLLPICSIQHTNEMMLNHIPANTSTNEEPKHSESKHYVRIVHVPKAIDTTPTKTEHGSYVILEFKEATSTVYLEECRSHKHPINVMLLPTSSCSHSKGGSYGTHLSAAPTGVVLIDLPLLVCTLFE